MQSLTALRITGCIIIIGYTCLETTHTCINTTNDLMSVINEPIQHVSSKRVSTFKRRARKERVKRLGSFLGVFFFLFIYFIFLEWKKRTARISPHWLSIMPVNWFTRQPVAQQWDLKQSTCYQLRAEQTGRNELFIIAVPINNTHTHTHSYAYVCIYIRTIYMVIKIFLNF